MGTQKEVKIHLQTTADDQAIKKTEKSLKAVNKAVEAGDYTEAAREADKLTEELEKMDGVGEDLRKTLLRVASGHKSVAEATQSAENTLEGLSRGLAKAKDELSKAEIGSEKFIAAQRKVTELERTREVAMRHGARATRNNGFAVLEASRAFEDMQYGIRGVLNNIPGLVQHLGAGAGVAGVISLVAVSASILIPKLQEMIEKNNGLKSAAVQLAETQARAAEEEQKRADAAKKIADTRAREQDSWLQDLELELQAQKLLIEARNSELAQIDKIFEKRKQLLELQQKVALLEIEAQDFKTPEDKAEAIEQVKNSYRRDGASVQRERNTTIVESAEKAILEEREKLYALEISKGSERLELQQEIQAAEKMLKEVVKQRVDQEIALLRRAESVPDLGDRFESLPGNADVEAAKKFAKQFKDSGNRALAEDAAGSDKQRVSLVAQQAENVDRVEKLESGLKKEIDNLKQRVEATFDVVEQANEGFKESKAQLEERIVKAEEQLKAAEVTDAIAELDALVKNKEDEQQDAVNELRQGLEKLKSTANEKQISDAAEELKAIEAVLADNVITREEVPKVADALRGILSDFSTGTVEQIKVISEAQAKFAQSQAELSGIIRNIQDQQRAVQAQLRELSAAQERLNSNLGG